jgi:hypothetical protein
MNILKDLNLEPKEAGPIFRYLCKNEKYDLAADFAISTLSENSLNDKYFQSVVKNEISTCKEKKIMAGLSALFVLLPEHDIKYRNTVSKSIETFMDEKARRGEYEDLLKSSSKDYSLVEKQDKIVDETIENALNNQTVQNIQALVDLQEKFGENPVQGPKIEHALNAILNSQEEEKKEELTGLAGKQEVEDYQEIPQQRHCAINLNKKIYISPDLRQFLESKIKLLENKPKVKLCENKFKINSPLFYITKKACKEQLQQQQYNKKYPFFHLLANNSNSGIDTEYKNKLLLNDSPNDNVD